MHGYHLQKYKFYDISTIIKRIEKQINISLLANGYEIIVFVVIFLSAGLLLEIPVGKIYHSRDQATSNEVWNLLGIKFILVAFVTFE